MSEHVHEELPLLLTGEADRQTVEAVGAHVAECSECCQALRSLVLAFSAITSAKRLEPELLPGAHMWDEPATDEPSELPDLSAMFARIEAEAAAAGGPAEGRPEAPSPEQPRPAAPPARHAEHPRESERRRRGRVVLAGLAAAACIALGAGVTYAVEHHTAAAPTAQVVHLEPFDIGRTSGTAKIIGSDKIQLDAPSLAQLGTTHFYQAWLTNAARTQLLSLGPLGPDGTGNYTLSTHLIETYSAIEVSVQPVNGNPAFSGISVLRGSYR
jgi:anti-sigma-K factor RskA